MDKDIHIRFQGWPKERQEAGARKRFEERWKHPGKARVVHPNHRSVIVPCGSCFSALLCASEVWDVPFDTVIDAVVQMCDQSLTVEKKPEIYG